MVRMSTRVLVLLVVAIIGIPFYLFVNHSDEATSIGRYFRNIDNGLHDDDLADISYGVIMDAGSTGTRLFLYSWTSKSDDQLIDIKPALDHTGNPVVKKVYPGLSSFADKPDRAAEYIKELLDYAIEYVPTEKRPYTPVFLMATAGMRLVPEEKQKAIINNLHINLPLMTPMQVMKEHIRVIEGKWEGIYSWIAVNYILDRFNVPKLESTTTTLTTEGPKRKPTVGMIDMGGASCQIAFELRPNDTFRTENVENVNLGCRDDSDKFKYKLYVTTFLGYGVNEGQRKYEEELTEKVVANNYSYVRDECLPVNLQKTVNKDDGSMFMRKGIGDWNSCVNYLGELLQKKGEEDDKKMCEDLCFFGSVEAPKINLSDMEMYGFSEYWFSVQDVLALGGHYNHTVLADKASHFCSQRWSAIQMAARRKLYPKADDERLRSQCFKSAWVTAVLHHGFNIDKKKNHFQTAFTIAGQEIQWALGAMIYHMRYFPLRDSGHNLVSNKHPDDQLTTSFSPMYALVIVFFCVAIAYSFAALKTSHRVGMRREASMWSYMMLSQEDSFRSPFRNGLNYA